jgi:hypothetical protein
VIVKRFYICKVITVKVNVRALVLSRSVPIFRPGISFTSAFPRLKVGTYIPVVKPLQLLSSLLFSLSFFFLNFTSPLFSDRMLGFNASKVAKVTRVVSEYSSEIWKVLKVEVSKEFASKTAGTNSLVVDSAPLVADHSSTAAAAVPWEGQAWKILTTPNQAIDFAALTAHLDELGVNDASALQVFEEEEIAAIAALLKKHPQKILLKIYSEAMAKA